MTVFIDAVGLQDFSRYFQDIPDKANRAARLAINQTAERKGLKLAREAMLAQVAWPTSYLTEKTRADEKRFRLSYKATDTRLEAGIQASQEATPLARFSPSRISFARGRRSRAPIRVTVQPGRTRTLERAFLLNLKSGNIGLGVRLKPGEVLENTIGAKLITSGPLAGVALLYGPSVDQVFRTVAVDISPPVLEELTTEFLRQLGRLLRDG